MVMRLYAIWKNPIFYDSVRIILRHPGLRWVGDTSNLDTSSLSILQLKPDIVLVEQTEEEIQYNIVQMLGKAPYQLRVISLNLEDNKLIIYQCDQMTINHSRDLLELVLGE